MSDDLAKRLRENTHMYQTDCELKMKCADRIEQLVATCEQLEEALLEAKSEMRDWGPDHPAMKMIDAALEGQNDEWLAKREEDTRITLAELKGKNT